MYKILAACLCLCIAASLKAQVLPAENDTVNYRLAGFSQPFKTTHTAYLLEVAEGNHTTIAGFEKNISISKTGTDNRIIAILPYFNHTYTWRMSAINADNSKVKTGPLHHFTTGKLAFTDSTRYRLRIIDTATHHKDMLVFYDDFKAICDMHGNVLWYLPSIPRIVEEFMNIRDLKPTAAGTITFMGGTHICEVDYGGKVLWQQPGPGEQLPDSNVQAFHHEFTRLQNGHYMVASFDLGTIELNIREFDTSAPRRLKFQYVKGEDGKYYRQFPVGCLKEFDAAGNLVWIWKVPPNVIKDSAFIKRLPRFAEELTPHMNSFYFDEDKNHIYISYRNAHTILKIKYPEGDVVAVYRGNKRNNPDFRAQHCVRLNSKGDIMLFNNNYLMGRDSNTSQKTSFVTVLKQMPGNTLKKTWEFSCRIDNQAAPSTGSGGGVFELKDGCIIATAGTAGRTFIADKDKKLVWNAVSEEKGDEGWHHYSQYRVSVIEDTDTLKKLIFSQIDRK